MQNSLKTYNNIFRDNSKIKMFITTAHFIKNRKIQMNKTKSKRSESENQFLILIINILNVVLDADSTNIYFLSMENVNILGFICKTF